MKRIQTLSIISGIAAGKVNVPISLNFQPSYFKIISCGVVDSTAYEIVTIRCLDISNDDLCIVASNTALLVPLTYLNTKYNFTGNYQNKSLAFQIFDAARILSATSDILIMTIQFFE